MLCYQVVLLPSSGLKQIYPPSMKGDILFIRQYNDGVYLYLHDDTFLLSFSILFTFFYFQISGASVEETLTGEVILSILKVTVNKPALYTCLASNRHSAGENTVKATAKVTVAGIVTLFHFQLDTLKN